MSMDWKEYNKKLIKRGEMIIDPFAFLTHKQKQKRKSRGSPVFYPHHIICAILFIKFVPDFLIDKQRDYQGKYLVEQVLLSLILEHFTIGSQKTK